MACSHCVGLVAQYFPAVKPRDRIYFLFKHTCAPCCSCERIEELLLALAKKTGVSLTEVVKVNEEYEAAAMALIEEYQED